MENNFMLIDTSSENLRIGYKINGIKGDKTFKNDTNHLENIIIEIDKIISETKSSKNDLKYIGGCCGPGSFTGIRIGLSTVQAIGFGGNIKSFGFNIFDIYKYLLKDFKNSLIVPLIDGKKNQFYCKFINSIDDNFYDFKASEIIDYIKKNNKHDNVIFVGKDFKKIKNEITEKEINYKYMYENDFTSSDLVNFGVYCVENSVFGELDPLYIRKSDAEINLIKNKVIN